MKTEVMTTYVSDTFGFGVRSDNHEQVFIPSSIVKVSKILMGHTYECVLTENRNDAKGNTPWFCTFIVMDEREADPEQAPSEPEVSPTDAMSQFLLDFLSESYCASTGEASAALQQAFNEADKFTARTLLGRLFSLGRVVKADVFKSAEQTKASMTMWAIDTDDFKMLSANHD